MKINIDSFRIQSKGSTSLGCVMLDNLARITIEEGKQMPGCPIIVVEYLAVQETIIMAIFRIFKRISLKVTFMVGN